MLYSKFRTQEEQLRFSEQQSHAWINHSPICTKIVDLNFNLQFMSTSGVKALCIEDISEFYGKPYPFEFYPKCFRDQMTKNLKKAVDTGEIVEQEAAVVDLNGNEVWFHSTISPVSENGEQVDYLMVVSIDTTEQNKARTNRKLSMAIESFDIAMNKLTKAENLASLGAMVPGITHEVSTPFGVGITGISYIQHIAEELSQKYINRKLTASDMEQYVKDIEETSNIALSSLTRANELMTSFKRLSVDQVSEQKRHFFMKKHIEEILLSLGNKIKKTNVKIEVQCSKSIAFEGYPGFYSQIITNLLLNSLKYAFKEEEKGLIHINFSTNKHLLILSFSDNGKGIDEKHINEIFTPFFSTGKNQGGSGLGLSIVQTLVVEKMNGTIKCNSTVGQGTTFTITVPMTAN